MKSITPTEKKILELIAEGFSTPGLAAFLGMNKYTVLSHRRSLMKKFNVRNSAQMVRKAIHDKVIGS